MKLTNKEILGFDDRLLLAIGIPLAGLILPLVMSGVTNILWEQYPVQVLISLLFVIVYWAAGRWMTLFFRRRYPGIPEYAKRITYLTSSMGLLILLMSYGCKPIIQALVLSATNIHAEPPNTLQVVLISSLVAMAVLGIYESMYAISRWKSSLLETEQLRRQNTQAQLETLKSQVNPHFLFNSLNTLASLVHDQPELSTEFIQKLSRIYRYILEIRDRELISVAEEMECIEAYLFLVETRFGENLQVEIELPEKYKQYYLAPLSIQILLENSIKHNIISKKKPLHIRLKVVDENTLQVRNNLQVKPQVNASTKTGLANIRSRYRLLVDKEVEVSDGPDYFTVSLPLLKLEHYARTDH